MATSHSVPVLMRVMSASLILAKRAGQFIREVQMSNTNLDIVEKVRLKFFLIQSRFSFCSGVVLARLGSQWSTNEGRSWIATVDCFVVVETFSTVEYTRRRSTLFVSGFFFRWSPVFAQNRIFHFKKLIPNQISMTWSNQIRMKYSKYHAQMNSKNCKRAM